MSIFFQDIFYFDFHVLCNTCRNTDFLWPAFSRIRADSTTLPKYRKIRVGENLCFTQWWIIDLALFQWSFNPPQDDSLCEYKVALVCDFMTNLCNISSLDAETFFSHFGEKLRGSYTQICRSKTCKSINLNSDNQWARKTILNSRDAFQYKIFQVTLIFLVLTKELWYLPEHGCFLNADEFLVFLGRGLFRTQSRIYYGAFWQK